MINSIALWKEIFSNPQNGLSRIDKDTKIFFPLLIVLLLMALSTALILPIIQSPEYSQALVRLQAADMAEKGSPMSREQMEAMERQLSSPQVKTITTLSSLIGGVVGYILMLLVTWLLLKLILVSVKAEAPMKVLFRIMVYIALISVVQALLKNIITVSGNWERYMRMVQSKEDLQIALSSPISLASVVSHEKAGITGYFLIDAVTDVFNWLYYIFLYLALRWTLNIEKRKALTATIISAIVFIGIGLLFSMIAR